MKAITCTIGTWRTIMIVALIGGFDDPAVQAESSARSLAGAVLPQAGPERSRWALNDGWEYLEDNREGSPDTLSDGWQQVHLPHTWNLWDTVDPVPGYRRDASWYRKTLSVPHLRGNVRTVLTFEGVNISCDIYVNGVRAGGHVGGYVGFDVDITSLVHEGSINTILVRVSNHYDPNILPSQKSDFCIYGGITRNVWLDIVPSTSMEVLHVRTPRVSNTRAEVEASVVIRRGNALKENLTVGWTIVDEDGREVSSREVPVRGFDSVVTVVMPPILQPRLWSPSNPALYTMRVRLTRSEGPVDVISDRFGCRWFEFKDHGPFMLNGKRLLLRGTHRHEDYAGYANAMPDSLQRRDMRMIKEMGANFVRLAHYPQAPEVYRACDELGILVWDELPWCRGGMGGGEWKMNTQRLLKEQINQHYNHPSIIIHSLGNELYWLPDFPGGDNIDSLRSMITVLNTIAHQLDPDRLTATRKFTEGADLVDIVSPSIWPGWYSGYYKGYETALNQAREKLPRFFHAEYGGDSHFGRHTENPISGEATTTTDGWEENIKPQKVRNVSQSGDWSENYIVNLFDWMLHVSERLPWFTGNAQWAFKDFPTPLRPENPIPYMNQKGLLDRSGNPKDAYFVFKSYWTTDPRFCYIESHTWTERAGPPDVKREVHVYSNCPAVELFLNGTSCGGKTRNSEDFPASGLRWPVSFAEGENHLTATGYLDGKPVATDSIAVRYTFTKPVEPDHIELSSAPLPRGLLLIHATVVDRSGNRCLDYNKRIYFASDGDGQLLVNYGTPTGSSVIEMANGQAAIQFRPSPYGPSVVEASNQDFKGAYLPIGEVGK